MMAAFFLIPVALLILGGIGTGLKGGFDTYEAKKSMDSSKSRNDDNVAMFNRQSTGTNASLEALGKTELETAKSLERFLTAFEKIHNKPEFSGQKLNASLPEFKHKEIRETSIATGAFLGAAGSAAAGAVFAAAASAGTMAAVTALGTASTGTAIASLSGAAATKAALAVLGGGTLAVGGGGVALGTMVLTASTAGVGVLVGGIAFVITGNTLRKKADEVYAEMLKNERVINKNTTSLKRIGAVANELQSTLNTIRSIYAREAQKLENLIAMESDWNRFTPDEARVVENNILIVSLLHKLINTPVLKGENEVTDNGIEVREAINIGKLALAEGGLS
jgi:hypothetical protein